MMRSRQIVKFIIILFAIVFPIGAVFPGPSRLQHKTSHLPDVEFGVNEYDEYQDENDRAKGQMWEEESHINKMGPEMFSFHSSLNFPDQLDLNIVWNSKWANDTNFGQISAVSIDPLGNIVIFHRGERIWDVGTFDNENRFDPNNGPIKENTIVAFDKSGKVIFQWGANMFYMPHGLTIDSLGNYWVTDVAMHQVFKFDAKDIEKLKSQLMISNSNVLQSSIIKPSITLGQAFLPGHDENTFCKPTAVAVQKNGDFFVSDGYCNSRIIKYNARGERILLWGRRRNEAEISSKSLPTFFFLVPHALALAEDSNQIFVADRENGRVLCFFASSGEFYKEYKNPIIGSKVYSVAYARKKLYLINGPDAPYKNFGFHVRGFVIDVNSGNIVSQFGPAGDMNNPHDIVVTEDTHEIYVVELNTHKIYQFLQGMNNTKIGRSSNYTVLMSPENLEIASLSDSGSNQSSKTVTLLLSILTATITLIIICLGTAIVVMRYRKRARRMDWESERSENFKLSSLLDKRKGKRFRFFEKRPNTRDFDKLNTEPETSDEENLENNLMKII